MYVNWDTKENTPDAPQPHRQLCLIEFAENEEYNKIKQEKH